VSDDGAPHAVHVAVAWDGDRLTTAVGARTAANASARPAVSLLYPLRVPGGYTVIVDGAADVVPHEDGQRLADTPTRAVLHRAATAPAERGSPCGADCVPLLDRRR
jgi:hypothetical protein